MTPIFQLLLIQDKTKFLSSVSECSSLITQVLDPLPLLAFCPLTSSQAVFLVLSHHWHFSKGLPFFPSVCLHLFSYFWNVLPLLLWPIRAYASWLSTCVWSMKVKVKLLSRVKLVTFKEMAVWHFRNCIFEKTACTLEKMACTFKKMTVQHLRNSPWMSYI